MQIELVEPFYSGSHKQWSDDLQRFSTHTVRIHSMLGKYWKWRMHGAAPYLAQKARGADLLLASDFLDLAQYLSLLPPNTYQKTALYFHENQLCYPWSPTDEDQYTGRDNHYAYINFSSALAADHLFFNSNYHRKAFLDALPAFLDQFPDYPLHDLVPKIAQKSEVLYLGLDLDGLEEKKTPSHSGPCILWNHRWEYDKNPEEFFQTLFRLQETGIQFQLVVLGQAFGPKPPIFEEARQRLQQHILHWGYASSRSEYAELLWKANIYPVTSNQDFFGISVVEALFCGNYPLLPNRLAYPEHLPSSEKAEYLYAPGSLYDRLFQVIQTGAYRSTASTIIEHVRRYNWKDCISTYDQRFSKLLDS